MMDWLQSLDWSFWGIWLLTGALMLTGFVGTVLPVIPGPLIIFVAAVLHLFLHPASGITWWCIAIMAIILVISTAVDFLSGAVGAKWFGGSRWGVAGVILGGIVGLFFGLVGVLIGPIIGGFMGEWFFAKKELRPAVKATWGSVLGTTVGLVVRLFLSAGMIAVFLVDAFWW